MRNKILVTVAGAFVLSTAGLAPYVANAYPSASKMHKDGEIKDPVKADKALSKDLDKNAKKNEHRARKDAKLAAHKAKKVSKDNG